MEPARLAKWLDDQIAAVTPEKFPKLVSGQCKVMAQKLCELRTFALTGGMEGMSANAAMKVADPAPFLARIDAHLDTWRARGVELEGEPFGVWLDERRGLRPRPATPRYVLRWDPADADKRLTAEELARIEKFVAWLKEPAAREVRIGRPDSARLRALAETFEQRFETMFPAELAALLSRVDGFEIHHADESTKPKLVDAGELDPESAVWSTAFDFDEGMELAATCYDGDELEFAWPLYGVVFNRFHYVTGPAQTDGRPPLTVWTHVQGQRTPEKLGTFWDFLERLQH